MIGYYQDWKRDLTDNDSITLTESHFYDMLNKPVLMNQRDKKGKSKQYLQSSFREPLLLMF